MLPEEYIFLSVIAIIWTEYFWELYLSIRQHKKYLLEVVLPPELETIFSQETYEKARLYGLDKSKFSIFSEVFSVLISTVVIYFFLIKYFWDLSQNAIELLGLENNEILHSAVFTFIVNTTNTFVSLPLNIYKTFVLEENHGFNKQTPSFFVKDKLKAYVLSQTIIIPLTCISIYIVKIGGDYFFVYLWVFATVALLFLMTIYPGFIAPLFDKYTPLPDGELKTKIEELAESIKFPLYKLYLVEGSKRSVHSNAYFYGFFKNKRIVLFDTLVKGYIKGDSKISEDKGCDTDEILAVLAHELGHWKFNHVMKNIAILEVNVFLQFVVFGLLFKFPQLYRAFGFNEEQPVIIGFIIVMQFIFAPYNSVITFLLTILSRKFEFQADAFAKSLGKAKDLGKALIKLNHDNLSFPVYDWLYSAWHHSHPTLLQRLAAFAKED